MKLHAFVPWLIVLGLCAAGCGAILGIDGEIIDPDLSGSDNRTGDFDASTDDAGDAGDSATSDH